MIEDYKVTRIVSKWIIDSPAYKEICKERLSLGDLLKDLSFKILTPEEKEWYEKYGPNDTRLQGGSIHPSNFNMNFNTDVNYNFHNYMYYNIEGTNERKYIYLYGNNYFTSTSNVEPDDLCRIPVNENYPRILPIPDYVDLRIFDEFKERYVKMLEKISDLQEQSLKLFGVLSSKINNLTVNDLKLYYTKLYNYSL